MPFDTTIENCNGDIADIAINYIFPINFEIRFMKISIFNPRSQMKYVITTVTTNCQGFFWTI